MKTSPESESEAWELAEALAAMPTSERRALLQDQPAQGGIETPRVTGQVSGQGREGWSAFLGELFGVHGRKGEDVTAASAKRLLAIARQLGHGEWEAHKVAARFAALEPVQEAWSDWVALADREELRLRLELIGSFGHLDDGLVPFLLFFFRASDPSLYQTAAISVGRLLPYSSRLASQVESYARERGLSLDAPVALEGQRANRRILLALAGACSTGEKALPTGTPLPTLPFQGHEDAWPLEELVQDAADLSVLLLALLTLAHSRYSQPHVDAISRQTLSDIPHMSPTLVSRRTVECWGKLFVACHAQPTSANDTSSAVDVWRSMLDRELDRQRAEQPHAFAPRVASFMRMDELCRSLALVGVPVLQTALESLMQGMNIEDQAFFLYRVLTWLNRQPERPEAWEIVEAALSPKASSMPPLVRAGWETLKDKDESVSVLLGNERIRSLTSFLNALLERLESREHWLATDSFTRALVLFLLLDQTQHPGLPAEQVKALMARHGVVPTLRNNEADDEDESRVGPMDRTARAGAAIVALVLRVLALEEQHDVEAFVDQQLLHQVEDPGVLLALLPSHRLSPLLPFLADAFEHQLRWRLQRDPDFDPYLLLYTTTIRDPHPAFFQQLRTVMTNRSYRRTSGVLEPVEAWVETLAREVVSLDDPAAPKPWDAPANGGLDQTRSPLFNAIGRARGQLRAVAEHQGDMRRELGLLVEFMGGASGDKPAGGETLPTFLSLFHEGHRPLLQSGYHAWAEATMSDLRRQVQGHVSDITHAMTLLVPENWESGEDVQEAGSRIRNSLQAIESVIAPAMPQVEESLLRETIRRIQTDLLSWLAGISSLAAAWRTVLSDAGAGSGAAWDRLLTHTTEIWKPPARAEFIIRAWESLQEQPTTASLLSTRQRRGGITGVFQFWTLLQARVESQGADEWETKLALVEWALDTPVQSRWTPEEQRLWREATAETYRSLLDEAMGAKWEARASHLLTASTYRPLRRLQSSTAHMEAARVWCFDRYRLESARRVRQDLQAVRGQKPVSRLSEAWAFFLHFTPVWIGLMVGAFLMQDFGDAWTEMAREGDVRGITLTCLVGLAGSFAYMLVNLRAQVRPEPGYRQWNAWAMRLGRLGLFMVCSVIYTVVVTSFLWFLLSSTDEVVHGIGAVGHIAAWSGFALLVGTFFGLIAKA